MDCLMAAASPYDCEIQVGAIMVQRADSRDIATSAEEVNEIRWRAKMERDHLNEFAAIEPESEICFLGKSFSEAIRSASDTHTDRVTFTLRIGHDYAIEMVGMQIER